MKIKRQDFKIFEDVEDRSGASFKKYVKPSSAFFNRDIFQSDRKLVYD